MSLITQLERDYKLTVTDLHAGARGVYKVVTKRNGVLCLKPYEAPRLDVKFTAQVLLHLMKSGYSYSPRLMPTAHGKPWMYRSGTRYMLSDWVQGTSPEFTHAAVLNNAVRALANFHKHAKGLKVHNAPEHRKPVFHLQERLLSSRRYIRSHLKLEQAKPYLHMCDRAMTYLKHPDVVRAIQREQAAGSFVHGDYASHNLLVDAKGHVHVIDFDMSSLQARMKELAHVIHRSHPWQGDDGALRLIELYDKVRPLSQRDLRLLVAFLAIPVPLMRSIYRAKIRFPKKETLRRQERWLRDLFG